MWEKKKVSLPTPSEIINLNIFHVLFYCKKVFQLHDSEVFKETFGGFRDILILRFSLKTIFRVISISISR